MKENERNEGKNLVQWRKAVQEKRLKKQFFGAKYKLEFNLKNVKKCQKMPKLIPKKFLKEFENSFLKINSRFKLHKFEFSILKWHFKTKISKIWNVHFQNRISDFILKNFPMFIPEIPIFNLKIRVWHFWTIFGRNRISKTKNLTGKKTTRET